METKTTKKHTITPEQMAMHLEAIQWIATQTADPAGAPMSRNLIHKQFNKAHGSLLPALVGAKAIVRTSNSPTAPKYAWTYSGGAIDETFVEGILASIRKHQNVKKAATRINPRDVNKVIASKLANKSVANAKSKGLLSAPEVTINPDTRVIHFDHPREVHINNNVIVMHDVTSLTFTTEGSRIVILANLGDHEVFVRIPNKPLQLVDRYQPGKPSSYVITTQ